MLHSLFFDIVGLGLPPEVQIIPWVLAVIWAIFILEKVGLFRLSPIAPRGDIATIITPNLGHKNLAHIAANSAGVIVILWLYMTKTPKPWPGLSVMFFGSTGLFWLFGPKNHNHGRGISYALYALNGWLLVWLYHEGKNAVEYWLFLAVAALVVVRGSLPGDARIAWSAHLSGLIVGIVWTSYSLGYFDRWIA